MKGEFNREAPYWPKDPRAAKRLEKMIEFGEFQKIPVESICTVIPRYLVTYMNSQTRSQIRSATVVSVTNLSTSTNLVSVSYYKGLTDNTSPVCTCSYSIPPDFTIDFSSRDLPIEITCCNCVCNPELDYDEGRAIVSSTHEQIGVSARVYYTAEKDDSKLKAITDSKIVPYGKGNAGD